MPKYQPHMSIVLVLVPLTGKTMRISGVHTPPHSLWNDHVTRVHMYMFSVCLYAVYISGMM
jgi:hypothetical protein